MLKWQIGAKVYSKLIVAQIELKGLAMTLSNLNPKEI
jgi:hypothetical protein